MYNKNDNIGEEKQILIDFLKDRERGQEDTLKLFKANINEFLCNNDTDDNAPTDEKEALYKAIKALYKEASDIQKSFGDTVADIMKSKGLTKYWHNKEILDIPKASELTGLNPNIFRTNMYNENCVVDMGLVISICIGFKLSPVLTDRLLQSAGLAFRLDNPEHLAYLFLLEYCMEYSIKECNEILEKLGISKTKRLGSYGRGKNGDSIEYKKHSLKQPQ